MRWPAHLADAPFADDATEAFFCSTNQHTHAESLHNAPVSQDIQDVPHHVAGSCTMACTVLLT